MLVLTCQILSSETGVVKVGIGFFLCYNISVIQSRTDCASVGCANNIGSCGLLGILQPEEYKENFNFLVVVPLSIQ
jgi:hypothetical protein